MDGNCIIRIGQMSEKPEKGDACLQQRECFSFLLGYHCVPAPAGKLVGQALLHRLQRQQEPAEKKQILMPKYSLVLFSCSFHEGCGKLGVFSQLTPQHKTLIYQVFICCAVTYCSC